MSGRFLTGGHRDALLVPFSESYSERQRQAQLEDQPLDLGTIVRIQQLAGRGYDVDRIVAELAPHRIPRETIIRVLTPSEQAAPRRPHRPERANVGYERVKRGWPGYGPRRT